MRDYEAYISGNLSKEAFLQRKTAAKADEAEAGIQVEENKLEGPCDFDFTLLLITFLDWKNISRLMIASCVSGITSCSSSGSSFTWSLPEDFPMGI